MIRTLIRVPVLLLVLVALFFVLRPHSSTSGSAADEQQEKTIDLVIEEGIMTPGEISVDEGDRVNLRIISNSPVGFHLHGYDLSEEVGPGESAELSFDATITGRFEIEDHITDAVPGRAPRAAAVEG